MTYMLGIHSRNNKNKNIRTHLTDGPRAMQMESLGKCPHRIGYDGCLELNGSNGEVTGDDDFKKKQGQKSGGAKKLARIMAKTALGSVGAPAETYGAIASLIGSVRKRANKTKNRARKSAGEYATRAWDGIQQSSGAIMNRMPISLTTGRSLSVACSRYLMAFMEPFSNEARNAYIPKPPSCRTQKATAYSRGTFSVSDAGSGFIMVAPCSASDQNSIWTSSTASVATSFTMPTASNANGIYGYPLGNLPFNRASITSTAVGTLVESRVVSYSLRVYYTGAVNTCSGTYYVYSDPDTDSVVGLGAYALGVRDATEVCAIQLGKSVSTIIIPVRGSQTQFPAPNSQNAYQVYPYSDSQTVVDATNSSTTSVGVPCAGVFIAGASAAATFNYEVVEHIEYNGNGVPQSFLTPSSADAVGFDLCQVVLNDAVRNISAHPTMLIGDAIKMSLRANGVTLARVPKY